MSRQTHELNILKFLHRCFLEIIRKLRSRGGSGIANEILQKAPEFCEVKVVCEGKETSQLGGSPSPLSSPRYQDDSFKDNNDHNSSIAEAEQQRNNSISCMCFKTRFV